MFEIILTIMLNMNDLIKHKDIKVESFLCKSDFFPHNLL